MSRIGKLPINIPSGVTVTIDKGNNVVVKGPKGQLQQSVNPDIKVTVEDNKVIVSRPTDNKRHRELHGLYRALINNMIIGVSQGYQTTLELIGVGYKADAKGQLLELGLGYSHNIFIELPKEISVETISEKKSAPKVKLSSIDKQLLGQVAAKIRSLRKPEPYKGKGVRYENEVVRRKAGKSAGKGK
ncbi:MAG TPA: 50S ribosomal protein L6 [Salinivirgaceae bacterium]|nr:50S ribosomal protein L6 [Salinivirgaceae bacterium]